MTFFIGLTVAIDYLIAIAWKIFWCWLGFNLGREFYKFIERKLRKDDNNESSNKN